MTDLTRNQVLARLPDDAREAIAQHLEREMLKQWQLLRDEHQPIERVYFPIDSVISVVSLMEDGAIAESYTAGRDGMGGSEIVWGEARPIFRSMCQIPGECYAMDASVLCGMARPAVSIAAGTLQRAGLVKYARGKMSITDRAGLEDASCECYRVIADEFVRVLGGPAARS